MFSGVVVSFHIPRKGLIVSVLLSKALRLRLVIIGGFIVCNVTNFWRCPQKAVPLHRHSKIFAYLDYLEYRFGLMRCLPIGRLVKSVRK